MRKKDFYQKKFIDGKLKINKPFKEFLSEEENLENIVSHVKDMKQLYSDTNMEELLTVIDEDSEIKIFENLEILDSFNNPIGNFENLQTLFYKFSLHENYPIMFEFQSNFFYWRNSINDGNSFYRIVIFLLIENYIINNNINYLNILICEMLSEDFYELYKKRNIDVKLIKDIFSLMLYFVKENKIKEAYLVLLKSYLLKNKNFDEALIIYLKHVISVCLKELFEHVDKNPNKKYENLKKKLCNLDGIEEFGIEPAISIIYILPFLFKINVKCIYLDGEIRKCNIGIMKTTLDENYSTLFFGNLFCSYYILYPGNINKIIKYVNNGNEIKNKQLTYLLKNKEQCKICNNEEEHLIFLEKKFKVCNKCLINYLNEIIKKRAEDIKEDNLFGLEYYTRRIHLQDKYYIDNDEFIEIREKNILEEIYFKFPSICSKCKKKVNTLQEIFNLNCDCNYCRKCLEDILNESTKNLKVLNDYELRTFEKTKCSCGKDFDPNYVLQYFGNLNESTTKAQQRMIECTETLCMICCRKIADCQLPKNKNEKCKIYEKEKIKKIQIIKENSRDKGLKYYDGEHIMCMNCFKNWKNNNNNDSNNNNNNNIDDEQVTDRTQSENNKNNDKKENDKKNVKKDDKKDDKKNVKRNDNNKIKCNICNKIHSVNIPLTEDGGCCPNCNIF